ncbi:MAG: copper amine oxidase N-terminal domain-containing protein [Defluviitaleaceae bacterium]|nr:copper amine oxidase N-terminal domain-containing protein [Defluviitaleaceae bacterium]
MKKCFIFFAVTVLFVFAHAAIYASGGINVVIDGIDVVFEDQEPVLVDGRTLVPVRGVFEVLGFYVEWEAETSTAVLISDSYVVKISIGQAVFYTNGLAHVLDVPAQIIGGRTMVPLRFPLESVGYDLAWDSMTQTVIITSRQAVVPILPTPEHDTSSIVAYYEPSEIPTGEISETPTPSPTPQLDGINIAVNGQSIPWAAGAEPFLSDAEMMIPVERVVDALGGTAFEMTVDGEQRLTILVGNNMLLILMGTSEYATSTIFEADGGYTFGETSSHFFSAPPVAIAGDVFFPFSNFAAALELEFARDGDSVEIIL